VEVLITHAGFGLSGAMEETSLDEACALFEVNLFGMARLTQKETHQLWIVKSPCE
jgi:short-subunit dehydrogenase